MIKAIDISELRIGYQTAKGHPLFVAGPMDLGVYKGELACLIGPNGSGKTTLIRTISTMQKPLAGQVQILGQNPEHFNRKERSRMISLVVTDQQVPGNMKVYELVSLGRYPHTGWFARFTSSDRERIKRAMDITGVLRFSNRPVITLSDGERQKVMIARALAQDTPVILLDEPTAHLDIPNRVSIMILLRKLARETGKAILLSTHELELALQAADRIWLIREDGTAVGGSPEELVMNGVIGQTFDDEHVRFDVSSGTFRMMNEGGKAVYVTGDGYARFWTRRALERIGFMPSDDPAAPVSITIRKPGNVLSWALIHEKEHREFGSIDELVMYLKKTGMNT